MNKHKARQNAKNKKSGKYLKAFTKCVKKTGRWRGHPASLADVGKKSPLVEKGHFSGRYGQKRAQQVKKQKSK